MRARTHKLGEAPRRVQSECRPALEQPAAPARHESKGKEGRGGGGQCAYASYRRQRATRYLWRAELRRVRLRSSSGGRSGRRTTRQPAHRAMVPRGGSEKGVCKLRRLGNARELGGGAPTPNPRHRGQRRTRVHGQGRGGRERMGTEGAARCKAEGTRGRTWERTRQRGEGKEEEEKEERGRGLKRGGTRHDGEDDDR